MIKMYEIKTIPRDFKIDVVKYPKGITVYNTGECPGKNSSPGFFMRSRQALKNQRMQEMLNYLNRKEN